jgi:hypothetical protein
VRLDEVVLRALEKKPELRYQQASVLKTQLETIAETPSPSDRQSGKPASKSSWTASWLISPLSSPEVREVSAHFTKAERSEFTFYGLLLGLWVVTATFGNLWLIRSFPAPGNWIVSSVIAMLFLASLPLMWRMQRRFLCSTAWAKENGYDATKIKLFSFSRKNLWLLIIFLPCRAFSYLARPN